MKPLPSTRVAEQREAVYERRRIDTGIPDEVAAALRENRGSAAFHAYVCRVRCGGHHGADFWTLQDVADAIGVTRERIRQMEVKCHSEGHARHPEVEHLPLADATFAVVPTGRYRWKRLGEDDQRRLRAAYVDGSKVRGNLRADDPRRADALAFVHLLVGFVMQGYPLKHLAEVCGCMPQALRSRLVRYGYLETTGTSPSYRPRMARRHTHPSAEN